MDEKLNRWTAQFVSPATEQAFRRYVFDDNLRTNRVAMVLATIFFTAYAVHDYVMLAEAVTAVKIRLATGAACALALATLFIPRWTLRHEAISAFIVVLMGVGINLIIHNEPDLNNTYYVAFIQGAVFVCFFLRTDFTKSIVAMLSFLIGTVLATHGKPQTEESLVQPVILLTMFMICGFASYLLQRYRRHDFQKTLIIDGQNKQLKILLEDSQRDNERKLAAMNLLVHFVKTPLHQINGFSDIVMNSLSRGDGRASFNDGVEGARYIKDATANLAKSVNSLLTYHRLDDLERQREYESIDVDDAVEDFADLLGEHIQIEKAGRAGAVRTVAPAVKTAVESLAKYYNETAHGATRLKVALSVDKSVARIVLRDNGHAITREEFAEKTKPLTKVDNYLTTAGTEMPMLLRTTARAVELCGGVFALGKTHEGNTFIITLVDKAARLSVESAAAA